MVYYIAIDASLSMDLRLDSTKKLGTASDRLCKTRYQHAVDIAAKLMLKSNESNIHPIVRLYLFGEGYEQFLGEVTNYEDIIAKVPEDPTSREIDKGKRGYGTTNIGQLIHHVNSNFEVSVKDKIIIITDCSTFEGSLNYVHGCETRFIITNSNRESMDEDQMNELDEIAATSLALQASVETECDWHHYFMGDFESKDALVASVVEDLFERSIYNLRLGHLCTKMKIDHSFNDPMTTEFNVIAFMHPTALGNTETTGTHHVFPVFITDDDIEETVEDTPSTGSPVSTRGSSPMSDYDSGRETPMEGYHSTVTPNETLESIDESDAHALTLPSEKPSSVNDELENGPMGKRRSFFPPGIFCDFTDKKTIPRFDSKEPSPVPSPKEHDMHVLFKDVSGQTSSSRPGDKRATEKQSESGRTTKRQRRATVQDGESDNDDEGTEDMPDMIRPFSPRTTIVEDEKKKEPEKREVVVKEEEEEMMNEESTETTDDSFNMELTIDEEDDGDVDRRDINHDFITNIVRDALRYVNTSRLNFVHGHPIMDEEDEDYPTAPYLVQILTAGLRTQDVVALCLTNTGVYAILSTTMNSNGDDILRMSTVQKPNKFTHTFVPDFEHVITHYLDPKLPVEQIRLSGKNKGTPASYVAHRTNWLTSDGISNDIVKIRKNLKKLPERAQYLYNDINRIYYYAHVIGQSQILPQLADRIIEEAKAISRDAIKHAEYVAEFYKSGAKAKRPYAIKLPVLNDQSQFNPYFAQQQAMLAAKNPPAASPNPQSPRPLMADPIMQRDIPGPHGQRPQNPTRDRPMNPNPHRNAHRDRPSNVHRDRPANPHAHRDRPQLGIPHRDRASSLNRNPHREGPNPHNPRPGNPNANPLHGQRPANPPFHQFHVKKRTN